MKKGTVAEKDSNHNYACDLFRFILSLGVMAVHVRWTGVVSPVYWWIYVEGFFMISGNFLAKHFDLEKSRFLGLTTDECVNQSIQYTWNKILKFLKYIIPILILEYLLQFVVLAAATFNFEDATTLLLEFTNELLMLSSMASEGRRHLGTLWYLSAMVIVLPSLCFLLLKFRKLYAYIVSWTLAIFFIAAKGFQTPAFGLVALNRAFCYMSLGISSYYLGKCIKEFCNSNQKKLIFTIAEILAVCYIVGGVSFNFANDSYYVVLMFYICITIMLSGCSYSSKLKGNVIKYLGELSVPIFVSQLFIGDFVYISSLLCKKYFEIQFSDTVKVAAYFILTIVFSMALKFFVGLFSKKQNMREYPSKTICSKKELIDRHDD